MRTEPRLLTDARGVTLCRGHHVRIIAPACGHIPRAMVGLLARVASVGDRGTLRLTHPAWKGERSVNAATARRCLLRVEPHTLKQAIKPVIVGATKNKAR